MAVRDLGKCRRQSAECRKPPKATTRPYTRHILGIDSGVQSHPKATSRLHQSHPKAPPKPGSLGQERHSRWPTGAGASPKSPGRVNLEMAVNAARPSRNRSQTSFNAETQRAQSNAEEKTIFFLLSLRSSANLCVSALVLRSLRANPEIAVQRRQEAKTQRSRRWGGEDRLKFTHPAGEGAR